jgi:hypothetical protein
MQVPLLKQSDGKKSASFTMMIVAFTVVTLWLLVSIVEVAFGIQIREFSGAEAMSYLTPICALYYGRRQATDRASGGSTTTTSPAEEKTEE